jgi:hypothetical protein
MSNGKQQLTDPAGRIFRSESPIETSAELKELIAANSIYQLNPQQYFAHGETRLSHI